MEEFSEGRFKQRAVIEFLTAEKVPPIEIHRRMHAIYGDQCVDVGTVRRWVSEVCNKEIVSKTKHQFFKDGFQKLEQRWRKCAEVLVILCKYNCATLKIIYVGIFLFFFLFH